MTTSNEPKQRPGRDGGGAGYRGTLPARGDRLARPWLIIVAAIFVGIMVLSVLGVPSRFIPDPTPVPLPTNPPATESPADTPAESPADSPAGSPTLEVSPSPSPTAS